MAVDMLATIIRLLERELEDKREHRKAHLMRQALIYLKRVKHEDEVHAEQ